MAIGNRIKARREELGLTQQQLADRLGYKSKATINKIEMGINGISQRRIVDFANALQTSIEYLMEMDKAGDELFAVCGQCKHYPESRIRKESC